MSETKKNNRFINWLKTSISIRMLIIGFLILILMIPLAYVKDLIKERKHRQTEVVLEINKSWGDAILLYGPILKIPYIEYVESTVTDDKTKKVQIVREKTMRYAYFFPNKLNLNGAIDAEVKKRGMYSTSVYKTKIGVSGDYSFPDIQALEISSKEVVWEKAQILIQTTNLKGINDEIVVTLNDKNLSFESKFQSQNNHTVSDEYLPTKFHSIETESFDFKDLSMNGRLEFQFQFNVSGSNKFQIIPIGKESKMHLTSNWKDASFVGEYLPNNPDKMKPDGFDARWRVLQMNRPYSQQFTYLPKLEEYAFGVNFFIPVDDYQQNERSAKYGYLVISLTFLLFFLIQVLSKINIHPFQYLMIGLALVIFYTLLLSISEHSDFTKAYLIAGSAVVALVSLYAISILKNWKFPFFIGLSLVALYSFIFVIIQLENYSLLVGSIGLFLILASVMYASRKIKWS